MSGRKSTAKSGINRIKSSSQTTIVSFYLNKLIRFFPKLKLNKQKWVQKRPFAFFCKPVSWIFLGFSIDLEDHYNWNVFCISVCRRYSLTKIRATSFFVTPLSCSENLIFLFCFVCVTYYSWGWLMSKFAFYLSFENFCLSKVKATSSLFRDIWTLDLS